eukprot:gene1551-16000_t
MTVAKDPVPKDPDFDQDDENDDDPEDVEMKLIGDIDSLSRTTERCLLSLKQGEDDDEKPVKSRDTWSNKTEFLLACVGYAVGLGNVWRFPWLAQKNGGGAFLIPYCIMLFIEGLPLFYLELSIGQRHHLGPVPLWSKVSKYSSGLGFTSVFTVFFMACTYNVVIAWCLYYLFASFQYPLPWSSCPTTSRISGNQTITKPLEKCDKAGSTAYYWYHVSLDIAKNINQRSGLNWKLSLSLLAAWVLVTGCMIKGIKSTGKVVYFTALFPYFVLLIFIIRGFMLEGFEDGLRHLFTPEWAMLKDPQVWLQAAAQILFSLSLANGGLIAYASYNPTHSNTLKDTFLICFINCGTSVFAGIAMFSMVGYRANYQNKHCQKYTYPQIDKRMEQLHPTIMKGNSSYTKFWNEIYDKGVRDNTYELCDVNRFLKEGSGGTGLAFITMTEVINQLPGSTFFSIVFFMMLVTLGLSSMFGNLESIVSSIKDMPYFKNVRNEYVIISIAIPSYLFGLIFMQDSGEYILQLFNSYSIDVPLLVIALCELLVIVWIYGVPRFCDDIEFMTGNRPHFIWKIMWRFVSPLVIASLLIGMVVSSAKGTLTYEVWNDVQYLQDLQKDPRVVQMWPSRRERMILEKVPYPGWAIAVGVIITLFPIFFTPGFGCYYFIQKVRQRDEISVPIGV